MKYIPKEKAETFIRGTTYQAREYDFKEPAMDLGIITCNGRVPEEGYATNLECKELFYVMSGTGILYTEEEKIPLKEGDATLLQENDLYYLEGTMTLAISCHPAFREDQHKIIRKRKR